MKGRALAISVALASSLVGGCARRPAAAPGRAPSGAISMLPDVRHADGRPPVALIARDGDPKSAVAVAVLTPRESAEPAVALSGVVGARLAAAGVDARVTPSSDGFRAVVLVGSAAEAARAAGAIHAALTRPVEATDVAAANVKLAALARRPLPDPALKAWARCVGAPYARPDRALARASADVATLEGWRRSAHGLGRVALAVTGPAALGEAVARVVADGPEWPAASPLAPDRARAAEPEIRVYDASSQGARSHAVVHATIAIDSASAAVATAAALGDPRGPLATRLAELELPFRLLEVTGTAHARGGCVGVVLEAAPPAGAKPSSDRAKVLAARVADAVALVDVEAAVHLGEAARAESGRALARRAGDAREAAERAAWWALVHDGPRRADARPGSRPSSVMLGVPRRREAAHASKEPAPIEPSRDALASALAQARQSWRAPVVEGRVRVERGQGEVWVLLASPCGTEGETAKDAGLTALFAVATAEIATRSPDVGVEPWIAPDGAGVLVHGPARQGEGPAAHARRLADLAARSFATSPLTATVLATARSDLLERETDGPVLSWLTRAIAPERPSRVVAFGLSDTVAAASDAAVVARAQALRAGPIRVAVLANVDAAQGSVVARAADRWIERRAGEPRACPASPKPEPPRPGTYAAPYRPGATPEAYLAFPFPAAARAAADVITAALDAPGGLLATAVVAPGLARRARARVLGWPDAPALVVRVESPQATLDAAVMQTRTLVDRVRKGGLSARDLARARGRVKRAATLSALDPRARVLATFRGEPALGAARASATDADVRAFVSEHLGDDGMIVIVSRPPRVVEPVKERDEP